MTCLAKVLNVVPRFSLSSYGTESAGNPSVFQAIDAQTGGINVNGALLFRSPVATGDKKETVEESSVS